MFAFNNEWPVNWYFILSGNGPPFSKTGTLQGSKVLEDKDDPFKIPKSNELGLGYSVQDTAGNNSKFSLVVDILYAYYHPPMPERPFSFVFKGEYTSCFERTACTKINKTY